MSMPSSPEQRARIIYISHGGGPLPLLGDLSHQAMIDFMYQLPEQLPRPQAILVISAHWEEQVPTLLAAPRPGMLYDYSGFPAETYRVIYPAAGAPELAGRIQAMLAGAGIKAGLDRERGFDHGLFIPLMMMYPAADIPALQLSLWDNLSAAAHIALGQALRPLLSEEVLIIGSGFSFHNLRAFSMTGQEDADPANNSFQEWLIATCCAGSNQQQEEGLINWESAPAARYCHPRAEHLLPLHVCAALAGHPARLIFDAPIMGKRAIALQW